MNQKLDEKQARFQSFTTSTRLGHIASNLSRIRSFAQVAHKEAVVSVISETTWFIEWAAAEIEPEQAEELVNIQIELVRWESIWDNIWANETVRAEIADQSRIWSERVLDMSGLLSEFVA